MSQSILEGDLFKALAGAVNFFRLKEICALRKSANILNAD